MQILTVTLNPTIDRVIEVPGLQIGQHAKGTLRWIMPAGKAINVSRTLATLGVPNTAVGFVGSETLGMFERAGHELGIATRFTPIAGRTRENITLIDPVGRTETHIRDVGPEVSPDEHAALAATLADCLEPESIVVFTGSLPRGITPEDFGELIDRCGECGARVVVDSSGEALRIAARRRLWFLKVNAEEFSELIGRPVREVGEIMTAARQLQPRPEHVVVTLGAAGAVSLAPEGVHAASISGPTTQVVSTVGCGDAFLGGYLAGTLRGDAAEALWLATSVATASAAYEMPARFEMSRVREIQRQVRVSRVEN